MIESNVLQRDLSKYLSRKKNSGSTPPLPLRRNKKRLNIELHILLHSETEFLESDDANKKEVKVNVKCE